jgi:hypothetical protein
VTWEKFMGQRGCILQPGREGLVTEECVSLVRKMFAASLHFPWLDKDCGRFHTLRVTIMAQLLAKP